MSVIESFSNSVQSFIVNCQKERPCMYDQQDWGMTLILLPLGWSFSLFSRAPQTRTSQLKEVLGFTDCLWRTFILINNTCNECIFIVNVVNVLGQDKFGSILFESAKILIAL